jgi:hypothetical protein
LNTACSRSSLAAGAASRSSAIRFAATTSKTGLEVRCELDPTTYPAGVKIADEELAAVDIVRHHFHGEWNYTIRPKAQTLQ